jgi:DNA-binding MarR family transcriptional regulator
MTVAPLQTHLGYWLRFVSNHVSLSFARKLETHDVTAAEWVILRELYDKEAAPSDLAEQLGLTRGAISKLADRLLGKALVTRTASRKDRRFQSLALTKAGRSLVPKLSILADQNDVEFFGHLTAKERTEITRFLKNMVDRYTLKSVPIE